MYHCILGMFSQFFLLGNRPILWKGHPIIISKLPAEHTSRIKTRSIFHFAYRQRSIAHQQRGGITEPVAVDKLENGCPVRIFFTASARSDRLVLSRTASSSRFNSASLNSCSSNISLPNCRKSRSSDSICSSGFCIMEIQSCSFVFCDCMVVSNKIRFFLRKRYKLYAFKEKRQELPRNPSCYNGFQRVA